MHRTSKHYTYDETAEYQTPKDNKHYEHAELSKDQLCNCFFKNKSSKNMGTTAHKTKTDLEGFCLWCGYMTFTGIEAYKVKYIDLSKINFENSTWLGIDD